LRHPAARDADASHRHVEREAAGRDAGDGDDAPFAEAHDRPLAELLLDLAQHVRDRLLALGVDLLGLLGLLGLFGPVASIRAVRGRHGDPPLVASGGAAPPNPHPFAPIRTKVERWYGGPEPSSRSLSKRSRSKIRPDSRPRVGQL